MERTTLRSADDLLRLGVGSESITTTGSHAFWVPGEGWRVARHLKPGEHLHSLTGAVVLETVEPSRPTEVYNLVVSDAHDYFAGRTAVLAHDVVPLAESGAGVPGLIHARIDSPQR